LTFGVWLYIETVYFSADSHLSKCNRSILLLYTEQRFNRDRSVNHYTPNQ